MAKPRKHAFRSLVIVAAALSTAASVWAQYPDKAVKLVVPYPPGGTGDLTSRVLAQQLGAQWKHPVVVENRPGVSNIVGAQAVAAAPRDAHTLLLCTTTISTNEAAYRTLPYRYSDLAPVSLIVRHPYALVVSPSLPAKTLPEFIAHARKNPGKVNFATLGPGSSSNFLTRELMRQHGLDMTEIPYKGSAQVAPDLMSGTVHFYMDAVNTALPLMRADKVRILAVTSPERLSVAQDLPTTREQGVNFSHDSWFGICTTAGSPQASVEALSDAVRKAVDSEEYRTRMKGLGAIPASSRSPEEFARFMKDETETWGRIIRPLNLKLD